MPIGIRRVIEVKRTEEQSSWDSVMSMSSVGIIRAGQRITTRGKYLNALGFYLYKYNNPTGDVTFTVRRVSDDALLASVVLGDASALASYPNLTYYEVTLPLLVALTEDVRILVEFSGGDASNEIRIGLNSADIRTDGCFTYYDTAYTDDSSSDCAYKMIYMIPTKR